MRDFPELPSLTGALLFVPASRPALFEKGAASGAALVIADLEDAVAAADKDEARRNLLRQGPAVPGCWRINAIGTPAHAADLAALQKAPPACVMLAKAEAGPAFDAFCAAVPGLPVIALIETARGLAEARRLAAHPSVVRLAFGSLDFCVDLDCAHIAAVLDPARAELVLASRLAGIAAPVDGVTTALQDQALVAGEAAHARAMGMGAKLAIHPAQVAPITAAFQPTEAEITRARAILAADDAVAVVGGEMVDAPVRARALQLLERAGLRV